VWVEINRTLTQQVRRQVGKADKPSAVIADSQSVKTIEKRVRSTALMEASSSRDAMRTPDCGSARLGAGSGC
jgi:putative transposase